MNRLGFEGKLYRNAGTYGVPTWAEVINMMDASLPDNREEAKNTTRGSGGVHTYEPGLRELELSFDMLEEVGDLDYDDFKAAYEAATELDIVIMNDGDMATSGSTGIRVPMKVFKFDKDENLSDPIKRSVTLKPCRSVNSVVGYVAV